MISLKSKTEKSVLKQYGAHRYKVDLPAQLADCEVSYQYLLRLLHQITDLEEGIRRCYILGCDADHESIIELSVIEQTKYTSLVHIIHYYQLQNVTACGKCESVSLDKENESEGKYFNGLSYRGDVRLYHDASMAEVVKCQRYRHFAPRYEYPNINMYQVNEKAQMNRFLRDMLAYCLANGRISEPVISPSGLPCRT